MPAIDVSDPYIIKFLIENYDKTERLRMKWNQLQRDTLLQAATFRGKEKGYNDTDVIKSDMAAGMPMITNSHISGTVNRRLKPISDVKSIIGVASLMKGHSIPEVGLGTVEEDPRVGRLDTDLTIDPKMRLMDPKQRKVLYKSKPMFGRNVYLKSRNKILPENRYYLQETSAWGYGWRLKDSTFSSNAPKCPRVYRLTRDVKSRTGPQPDPPYYKSSNIPGLSLCASD